MGLRCVFPSLLGVYSPDYIVDGEALGALEAAGAYGPLRPCEVATRMRDLTVLQSEVAPILLYLYATWPCCRARSHRISSEAI